MIAPADRAIYETAGSADEAAQKILNFYSVYHSIRYVGEELVLRLKRPLPGGIPAQLTQAFADLLTSGVIRQGAALPEEADEPLLKDFSRLILRFNRESYGRLIQLIHRINDVGAGGGRQGAGA